MKQIAPVDMDAFFVSVELLYRPELRCIRRMLSPQTTLPVREPAGQPAGSWRVHRTIWNDAPA